MINDDLESLERGELWLGPGSRLAKASAELRTKFSFSWFSSVRSKLF